jgi:hypothetical protein
MVGQKLKAMNKKFASGGIVGGSTITTASAMVGVARSIPESYIIADGKNLIIGYNLPGNKGRNYFCLKNVYLKDFQLNISTDDMPHGQLDLNWFDSESKSFEIPDHIPKEQHTKYIKEQFDLED